MSDFDITDVSSLLNMIRSHSNDPQIKDWAEKADRALEGAGEPDPYADRVERFHDAVRADGDEDYLTVVANRFDDDDLPSLPSTSEAVADQLAEMKAERNRLFWAAFLAEETGEVASCLTSGEPPENFEDEVGDVMVLAFAIADVFGFEPGEVFDRVMTENEKKPKRQEGTGKLPDEAREGWRDGDGG